MRRNARTITTSPEIVKHIHGLTEANFKLLTELIEWLGANETRERKFRASMLIHLSRIETTASMILVGQMAEQQLKKQPFYNHDKLKEDAKAAEESIAAQSNQTGVTMLRFIYGNDPIPEVRRDRRNKWHGWEI